MKPRVATLGVLMCAAPLFSGCSFPLQGYNWREWNALSAAERRRLVDERYPSNPEMHRALAEDARKLGEGSR
jgi:hypothetical protein